MVAKNVRLSLCSTRVLNAAENSIVHSVYVEVHPTFWTLPDGPQDQIRNMVVHMEVYNDSKGKSSK